MNEIQEKLAERKEIEDRIIQKYKNIKRLEANGKLTDEQLKRMADVEKVYQKFLRSKEIMEALDKLIGIK